MVSSTKGLLETSWSSLLGSSFLYKKAISVPIPIFSSEFHLLQEGELNQKNSSINTTHTEWENTNSTSHGF